MTDSNAEFERDVVCGMEFPLTKDTRRVKHKGRTYYFDSLECAMKFQANPEPFVNPPEVA